MRGPFGDFKSSEEEWADPLEKEQQERVVLEKRGFLPFPPRGRWDSA